MRPAVAIDDAPAVEVIRGDLHPHPIPRQDPDAEAAHLAGHVAEHFMAVVELHPEHRVRERLHDLAFEFDLLFLGQELDGPDVRGLRALAGLAELVLHLRAFRKGAEAVALLVAEPLDDTSCHTTPPHCWIDARGGAAGHCLPACFSPPAGDPS